MKKMTIIGAGAWGTSLAHAFQNSILQVQLWSKNSSIVTEINDFGTNTKYTGDKVLTNIKASTNLKESLAGADIIVNAIPAYAIREVFQEAKDYIKEEVIVINASKGIDTKTHQFPNEVFAQILPASAHYFSLFGPSFASGVLSNHPTSINIAGINHHLLRDLENILKNKKIFLIPISDIIGVEWGGIYKNVVAIASGFAAGLGYGENTNALIFSAGFKEMVQSGIKIGAKLETFYEPCGVGDLMLSTSSMKSRNYSFGFYLGKGEAPEEISHKLSGVAEGYYTLLSISYLKKKYSLALPLTDMLHEIIYNKGDYKAAFIKFLAMHFK